MPRSNYVHVHVEEILKETDNAFLVLIEDDEYWIPKSQIADPDDYQMGDKDFDLAITEWIAKQNNLEGEE